MRSGQHAPAEGLRPSVRRERPNTASPWAHKPPAASLGPRAITAHTCGLSAAPFAALVRTRRERSVRSARPSRLLHSSRHHLVWSLAVSHAVILCTLAETAAPLRCPDGDGGARAGGCRRRCAHRRSRGAHSSTAPPCQARRLRKGRTKVWSSPGCWIARNRQIGLPPDRRRPSENTPVGSTVKPRPSCRNRAERRGSFRTFQQVHSASAKPQSKLRDALWKGARSLVARPGCVWRARPAAATHAARRTTSHARPHIRSHGSRVSPAAGGWDGTRAWLKLRRPPSAVWWWGQVPAAFPPSAPPPSCGNAAAAPPPTCPPSSRRRPCFLWQEAPSSLGSSPSCQPKVRLRSAPDGPCQLAALEQRTHARPSRTATLRALPHRASALKTRGAGWQPQPSEQPRICASRTALAVMLRAQQHATLPPHRAGACNPPLAHAPPLARCLWQEAMEGAASSAAGSSAAGSSAPGGNGNAEYRR